MFSRIKNFQDPKKAAEDAAIVEMLNETQAMISFLPDGTIIQANDVFLSTLGYTASEVEGNHHRMFCDPIYASSADYAEFWERLANGEASTGEFERFHKDGTSVWIHATYAAVRSAEGNVVRVTKLAQDISEQKRAMQQFLDALERLSAGESGARVLLEERNSLFPIAANFNRAMDVIQKDVLDLKEQAESVAEDTVKRKQRNTEMMERANAQETRIGKMSDLTAAASETMGRTQKTVEGAMGRLNPAMESLQKGQDLIEAARQTTQSLEEKTKSMSDINRMIEGLAFQTNLLALNAGVEAARAGEAGAGFSVVASEIRSLAQQSTQASSQINDLIRETTETTTRAAEDVGAGHKSFSKIKGELVALQEAFAPVVGELSEQVQQSASVNSSVSDSLKSVIADREAGQRNQQAIDEQVEVLAQLCDRLKGIAHQFAG